MAQRTDHPIGAIAAAVAAVTALALTAWRNEPNTLLDTSLTETDNRPLTENPINLRTGGR